MGYDYFLIISSSPFSRPFPLLLIIILPLLMKIAADDNYPLYNCSSTSGEYSENSTYKSNLMNLLADLNNKSLDHVFYNTSYGRDPDRVYGLALCHGNTFSSKCQSCVKYATDYITEFYTCQNNKAVIYWLDFCYVKYSNVDFFGDIDTDNKLTLVNPRNVSYNLGAVALGLLRNLSKNAIEIADNHMFATGKVLEPQERVYIYGLVQCSGDLSKFDCSKCVDYAMKQLPTNSTSLGAMAVTGSCIVRYETYAFI